MFKPTSFHRYPIEKNFQGKLFEEYKYNLDKLIQLNRLSLNLGKIINLRVKRYQKKLHLSVNVQVIFIFSKSLKKSYALIEL